MSAIVNNLISPVNLNRATVGGTAKVSPVKKRAVDMHKDTILANQAEKMFSETFDKVSKKPFPDAKNADYIPALAKQDSDLFGMSARLIRDGNKISVVSKGDFNAPVTIQSTSKLFQALIAHDTNPKEFSQLVGKRASSLPFNAETSLNNAQNSVKDKMIKEYGEDSKALIDNIFGQLNKVILTGAQDEEADPDSAANPSDNYGAMLTVYAGMSDKTAFHLSEDDKTSSRYSGEPYSLDEKHLEGRLQKYAKSIDKMSGADLEKYVEKLAAPLLQKMKDLAQNPNSTPSIKIDLNVFKSEMETATNNMKLILKMQDKGLISKNIDPIKLLERYTANCSISMGTKDLADAATTVANGGKNLFTGKQIFTPETVKAVLPVIRKTGLYLESDSFNKDAGSGAAKSGVGGMIVKIWEGKGAAVTLAPPLNKDSNSAKGVEFFKELSKSGVDQLLEEAV